MRRTRRLVGRLWFALLAAALLTLVGAVVAIDLGRRDAAALRAGEAPAREGVAAARQSLVQADNVAITQFRDQGSPSPASAGPGETYFSATAAAGRQLAQISQADIGGPAAESVQVLNGLLLTYGGLIEQAFRPTVSTDLNLAYLQYAHNFLNDEILPQLRTLQSEIDQAQPARPGRGRHVLWMVPLAVLAGLLIWTQLALARRFRRTLSVPLLLATVLAGLLGAVASLSRDTDADVAAGRATLTTLIKDYGDEETRNRGDGCPALRTMSRKWEEVEAPCTPAASADVIQPRELLEKANDVTMTAQSASATGTRDIVLVIVIGLALGLSITRGLLPRVEEYRFRRR
ncbi:hypothetical protein [Actinoplanes sp. NPDC049265]|uniref:hypothetical protein n=1 Tax=Actinoplanes sp. NPDC049265 TaxID=3363902 RepID=UPI0037229F89